MKEKYLARWEPFRDLLSMRSDFDRLFESFFSQVPEVPVVKEEFWAPVIDVVEHDGKIEVKAELPGMKKDDIKVTVKDNMLSVSGERKQEKETKEKTFHRIERSYGKFSRTITLPTAVDADRIKATYKDGILNITLPKPESIKPKQIDVEIK
jgi:HSP20 family protein